MLNKNFIFIYVSIKIGSRSPQKSFCLEIWDKSQRSKNKRELWNFRIKSSLRYRLSESCFINLANVYGVSKAQ